ncbi:MAG: hypothetical protein ABI361_03625 [Nitrososphaera sp.]
MPDINIEFTCMIPIVPPITLIEVQDAGLLDAALSEKDRRYSSTKL